MGRPSREPVSRRRPRVRRTALVASTLVAAAVVATWLAYQASADLPGTVVPDQGNLHIATETSPHEPYNSEPPTSGPHVPYIAPWGIHTRPIPRELQVHNLEDGGVLLQYSCECAADVERLQAIVERYPRQVILAPFPDMKARIALTAWARLDTMEAVDDARIVRFIEAFRGIDHHR